MQNCWWDICQRFDKVNGGSGKKVERSLPIQKLENQCGKIKNEIKISALQCGEINL